MKDLYIYHPHNTPEEANIKYHIIEDDAGKSLCGFTHSAYSCNGDAITIEWFDINIVKCESSFMCKKCVKKASKLLQEEDGVYDEPTGNKSMPPEYRYNPMYK